MKKIAKLAVAAALAGTSLTASAWYWGPYGTPYWGGYAPVAVAPIYAPTQEQIQAMADARRQAAEQWATAGRGSWGYGPWGADPFGSDRFSAASPWMPSDMTAMFEQAEAEREAALAESAARRAAAKARFAAQVAATKARREAWRAAHPIPEMGPSGVAAPAAAEPAPVESAPAPVAEAAPAVPAAEAKAQ